MQRRTGGGIPSQIAQSNRASGGGVQGTDIGDVLPGVLESLQESAAATVTPRLYYDEILGRFNYPSYQRTYGVYNNDFLNITRFGDQGEIFLEKDFFWKGPCMVNLRPEIPSRFCGTIGCGASTYRTTTNFALGGPSMVKDSVRVRPQIFYSYGAGYAAVKQIEMNLGGGMTYRLDRYANFAAVMCSAFSIAQRYTLMKISGSGVIQNCTGGFDEYLGVGVSTSENVLTFNYAGTGAIAAADSAVIQPRVLMPAYDNWLVAVKTPHTNFNNPRNPRKSLDTNLFSEPFNLRIFTAKLSEFCDSGCGFQPMPGYTPTSDFNNVFTVLNHCLTFLDHYRQYLFYGGDYFTNESGGHVSYIGAANSSDTTFTNLTSADNVIYTDLPSFKAICYPSEDVLLSQGNPKPEVLKSLDEIPVSVSHIVSSLRLTNPILGAYDVLKGRLDQAVYYPFQHFTTQAYYPSNPTYKELTMEDYIYGNYLESSVPLEQKTLIRQTINIPVNPMTSMYIMVFREKDRDNPVARIGGYSPALFWNALHLPRYSVTYGAEKLIQKDNAAEELMDEIYNSCSALCVPYRGGACTRGEMLRSKQFAGEGVPSIIAGASSNHTGLYTGVARNAFIYEVSLVEHRPLPTEEIFQQTPSFLGEQLNFDFYYDPVLQQNAGPGGAFDPASDLSMKDFYNPNTENGVFDVHNLYNLEVTEIRDLADNVQQGVQQQVHGTSQSDIGYQKACNSWVLNNGPLLVQVVYAQNALWQLNPNFSKVVFSRG